MIFVEKFKGFGISIAADVPLDTALSLAKIADQNQLNLFAVGEGINARSAIVTAAAIACNTTNINVGIGVFTPYLRHLSSIATDSMCLDELSKGRFMFGLGVPIWKMADYGFTLKSLRPLETMREAYIILKDLTSGRPSSIKSEFFGIPKNLKIDLKP